MTPESPREVAIENLKISVTAAEDIMQDIRVQLDRLMEEGDGISLVCDSCDAGMDLTLAQALREGWLNLNHAPDLPSANFIGTCPSCLAAEEAEQARLNEEFQARQKQTEPKSKPTSLFPLDND